jgi:hypothetical protein
MLLTKPTCMQTFECMKEYAKHVRSPPIASMLAVGGVDMGAQVLTKPLCC